MYIFIYIYMYHIYVSMFVYVCVYRHATGEASDMLVLVFVRSASNLEHDYLGLYAVLDTSHDSGPGAARPAQPPALSVVQQWLHVLLGSSTWRGHWLSVLDDFASSRFDGDCEHGCS